jgi:hypothetical protein
MGERFKLVFVDFDGPCAGDARERSGRKYLEAFSSTMDAWEI